MDIPEIKVDKILYATDLSETAFNALSHAVNLADKYKASIVMLHVLAEVPNLDSKLIGYIGASRWEKIKQQHYNEAMGALIGKKKMHTEIQAALYEMGKDAQESIDGMPCDEDEIHVRVGQPADIIIEQAEESNCDIIVMGTHGFGVLSDNKIGGTTLRVLRKSQKPVIVIRLPD